LNQLFIQLFLFKKAVMEKSTMVNIEKRFDVNKERLYQAWTQEAELKQWWKPMNKTLLHVENELKEGGNVVYTFENELKIHGRYKEVAKGEKLVYSWVWDLPGDSHHKGEYLLTVYFKEENESSVLQVTQHEFKNEHAVKPHTDGWEKALEDLNQYLADSET
jgi:uncharacterized protein YndB with AHSA1/START domain